MRKKVVMLVTQFAMMDPGPAGDSWASRISRAIAHFFGFGDPPMRPGEEFGPARPAITLAAMPEPDSELRLISPTPEASSTATFPWRRHEQLRERPTSDLPDDERQARHHAVRGLYAARADALDAAQYHFTCAAACDDIDLSQIPGFWQLSRSGMLTAVRAYEAAGRLRDASALNARIRTSLRPRSLSPVPGNVTELPVRRRLTQSANS